MRMATRGSVLIYRPTNRLDAGIDSRGRGDRSASQYLHYTARERRKLSISAG
jgi:hypothetical protein